jgi:II/X family phage/plasmid replication protein
MALDTLKVRSPKLSEDVAVHIEQQLIMRVAVDQATGEILYEMFNGPVLASWDSRISVQLMREEWRHCDGVLNKFRCRPYLVVQGSVHKAMLGHNLYGGPCDLQAAAMWFIQHVAVGLGCELPSAAEWHVRQADWAEVFDLGYDATQLYIHGLNSAKFPRRKHGKLARYGDNSFHVPGDTTTVKVYAKGVEFAAHDGRRLKRILDPQELAILSNKADNLLRVEVSVRAPKLDGDFGHPPTVGEVTTEYLTKVHDVEIARLLKEGTADMETVRKYSDVERRLREFYCDKPRLASTLFATWSKLALVGEWEVRAFMSESTYYRHLACLKAAGVSFLGTDVRLIEVASILPADFSPVRKDPRRLTGEDPKVIELLAPYRKVA